jgi:hypothetical protein
VCSDFVFLCEGFSDTVHVVFCIYMTYSTFYGQFDWLWIHGMEWNAMQCNAMQCNAMQCNASNVNPAMYGFMEWYINMNTNNQNVKLLCSYFANEYYGRFQVGVLLQLLTSHLQKRNNFQIYITKLGTFLPPLAAKTGQNHHHL